MPAEERDELAGVEGPEGEDEWLPITDRSHPAEIVRRRWGDRLDRFSLPCPVCRGTMTFQGVRTEQLYEFAAGEPDTVTPLAVQPLTFICERCGYSADFDAELFNPAHLAQLQGAPPERVAALSVRDYQVLVPLTGGERSTTLLDLASAVAGVRHGEVVVLHVAPPAAGDSALADALRERLEHYTPEVGNPAPVQLLRRQAGDVGDAIVATAADERVELLLAGWRGWTRGHDAVMGHVLDTLLNEALCDVGVVHDRGLAAVRRILLPTAGGPHARVGAALAFDLALAFGAELELFYVAAPGTPDPERAGGAAMRTILRELGDRQPEEGPTVDVLRRVTTAPDAAQAIVEEAAAYDLVVLGASPRNWLGRIRRGDLALKIARNCNPTSIVVSARTSLLSSWLSRMMG
jgi:nucleotide-binding universal stress UspA family protein